MHYVRILRFLYLCFCKWKGILLTFPFLRFFRERDTDKDGKVNFKEFFHGLFDMVRNYDEEDHGSNDHSHESEGSPARKLFAELDKDGDGW